MIPALIKKFQDALDAGATAIEVWGTGKASREFLYVEDAARGICLAAEGYDGAEPVNLGAGLRDLDPRPRRADRPAHGLPRRDPLGPEQARRPAPALPRHRRGPSGSSASAPTTSFEDGLKRTIEWYRRERSLPDSGSLNDPLLDEVRRFYEENHDGIEASRRRRRYFYDYLTRVIQGPHPRRASGSSTSAAAPATSWPRLRPSRGVGIDVSAPRDRGGPAARIAGETSTSSRATAPTRGCWRSWAGPSTSSCS